MDQTDIDPLELAALIGSRICHDIISPVGAIANGLEVLETEKDESMREFAMDLVKQSSSQASAKLQFARLAFGASGGAGAEIDMVDAGRCATGFFEREKADLEWQVTAPMLGKAEAKLLLNLLMIAANAAARGGRVQVSAERTDDGTEMRIVVDGDRAKCAPGITEVIADGERPDPLDAHSVQPLYTQLLARQAGMAVSVSEDEDRVVLGARSVAKQADMPVAAAG